MELENLLLEDKQPRVCFTLRLEPKVYEPLKEAARKEGCSMNHIISKVLEDTIITNH
jgi:predicted HicB family RNase H-like nuclease